MRIFLIVLAFLTLAATSAQAKRHHYKPHAVTHQAGHKYSVKQKWRKSAPAPVVIAKRHHHRRLWAANPHHPRVHVAKSHKPAQHLARAPHRARPAIIATEQEKHNIFARYALSHSANAPTNLLPGPLQAKLAEIANACTGFVVISTRCGRGGHSWNVKGTNHGSLHCVNKAADFRVASYSCAYAHLRDWHGGMSTDPHVVNHVHLSYAPGSHEFGRHFAHRGHGPRYATRHHQRVAHWRGGKHYRRLAGA